MLSIKLKYFRSSRNHHLREYFNQTQLEIENQKPQAHRDNSAYQVLSC